MSSFSDNNCTSNFNPTSYYSDQGFPFPNNDTCFSLFHPPSPLLLSFENETLLLPYLQNLETQPQSLTNEDNNDPLIAEETLDESKGSKKMRKTPVKKCPKKGKPSKIVTSRGPRDRRMRLSLEVATNFFGLHEMLGYDKASKTLEWLLNKSESAIMELSKEKCESQGGGANTTSSTPESEVTSNGVLGRENDNSSSCPKEKKKKTKPPRVSRPIAKISREKARERARARTSAKNKLLITQSPPA